jgi:hypothetical protein
MALKAAASRSRTASPRSGPVGCRADTALRSYFLVSGAAAALEALYILKL